MTIVVLGAKWNKKTLGNQTDICTWSFDNGKTITTGEGGIVILITKIFINYVRI